MASNGALETNDEDEDEDDAEEGPLDGKEAESYQLLAPAWLHTFTDTLILGLGGML